MRRYSTSAGLCRGLLYNFVKTNKRSSISLTSTPPYPSDRIVDYIIDYDNNNYYTSKENYESFGQWVKVELKDIFIDLKAYALVQAGNYPRHWDILVSMDGVNWNTPHEIRNNDDTYNGHIFSFNKYIVFIRYFKLINRGMNHKDDTGNSALYITNIDLYGNVIECVNNCTVLPHIYFTNKHCRTSIGNSFTLILLFLYKT